MKLLTVEIKGEYKGLINQTFDFRNSTGNVLALVGRNGSGKSHLLELVAEIFAYIERYRRPEFRVRKPILFDAVIEYQVYESIDPPDLQTYRLTIDVSGQVWAERLDQDNIYRAITLDAATYPEHIVGYSSGLNENLQRGFMKNAVQFFDVMRVRSNRRKKLADNIDELSVANINRYYLSRYRGIFYEPSEQSQIEDGYLSLKEADTRLPSLTFLDYDCNALLMASMALLPREEITELFPDIQYRFPKKVTLRYDLRKAPVEEDAIRDICKLIQVVGQSAVSGHSRPTTEEEYNVYELNFLAANVELDFSDGGLRERLSESYYNDPLIFFERLYKIQMLGVQSWDTSDKADLRDDGFEGCVKKPLKTMLPLSVVGFKLESAAGDVIDFDDLSDGESQLIQVVSAARIYRETRSLFILDEPETHLNPSWRNQFHQYLEKALKTDGQENLNVQVFLSSHSPFLVSSLQQENVYKFERSDNDVITMEPAPSQTYGASFDVLIKRFFGLDSLISQTAVEDIKQRLDNSSREEARSWLEENVGESMERAYLLRRLEE